MKVLLVVALAVLQLELAASVVNRFAFQASDEAQMILADAYELRRQRESSPIKTGIELFRRLFKRAQPQARALSDARIQMEWMVKRTERLSGTRGERPGDSLSEDTLEMLLLESRCKGPTPKCDFPTVDKFRTIDGTCNNLAFGKQTFGAAFTPFSRLLSANYEDGISQPLGFQQAFKERRPFEPRRPSARFISTKVIQDLPINDQQQATYMLMQWGQFLDHDYAYLIESSTLSGEEIECNTCTPMGECVPIPVPKDDPQFGVGTIQNGNCLSFIRAGASCVRPRGGPLFGPREQLNQITHWIDASNVYGSLPEEEKELRAFRNGLLREGPDRTLPVDPDPRLECPGTTPCFLGGDLRANEQVVLTVMHTIFLREHNRIARQLGALNPEWDDERIYQEARKIVGAIAQVITYKEYLPEILGQEFLDRLLGPYTGYDPNIDNPNLPNSFGAAAYRIGHSQIQEQFTLIDVDGRKGSLPLVYAFFNPGQYFKNGGTDKFLRGLLDQQSRNIDEFVTRTLTNRLFERPGEAGTDLASLNIQRGRDHGLPSYRMFRNFCAGKFGLRGQIVNPETLRRLREVYGSEDDIDLWVGGLAETPLPGARIGPTFACIFAITFRGLREGDRFYYENPGVFTPEQLSEIKKATLSKVVCDNGDDIRAAQPNAFSSIQAQRSCRLLPGIDLSKWREGSTGGSSDGDCYIKVLTRVDSSPPSSVRASVYTRPSDNGVMWTLDDRGLATPDNSNTKATCLKFTCPPAEGIKIGVRARSVLGRCSLQQVTGSLPINRSRNLSTYLAIIEQRFGPDVGIYTSLQECKSGGGSLQEEPTRGVALSFRCP